MGLDQYFYRVKTDMTTQQFSDEIKKMDLDKYGFVNQEQMDKLEKRVKIKEVGHLRKEYGFDNYMTEIYHEKGRKSFQPNCEYLEVTIEDISDIIKTFYNNSNVIYMMGILLQEISDGYKIWYLTWW